jgi:hypothetical protein
LLAQELWRIPLANASRNTRTRSLVVTAVAALAFSMPAFTAQAETRDEKCEKTLKKYYGAASVGDMSTNNKSNNNNKNNRATYATATLDNGETIRVRCGYQHGDVANIQVYAPAPPGGPLSGPMWGPADAYRTPPRPDPEPEAKPDENKEAKAEPQPGTPAPDTAGELKAPPKPGEVPQIGQAPETPPAGATPETPQNGDSAQSAETPQPEDTGSRWLKPPSSGS